MVKLTDDQQYVIDECTIKIITTDRTQIKGVVNKKGLKRTSDLFTEDDSPFIIVYKAITKGQENKVLAVNKTQIIWAELEDDGIQEISEINARESLTWADNKISTSGFVSDAKIFGEIDYGIDPNYTWDPSDPTISGGTLFFKEKSFTLSRTAPSFLKPAVWNRK